MTTQALVSIWHLDEANALVLSNQNKQRSLSAIQSGRSLSVKVNWPDRSSEVDIAVTCSLAELRVRLCNLLREEIDHNKARLRELGFDPDALPPAST